MQAEELGHQVGRTEMWFHVHKKPDGNYVNEAAKTIGVIFCFDFCFIGIHTLVRKIIHCLIYFYRTKLRKHYPKILLHNQKPCHKMMHLPKCVGRSIQVVCEV